MSRTHISKHQRYENLEDKSDYDWSEMPDANLAREWSERPDDSFARPVEPVGPLRNSGPPSMLTRTSSVASSASGTHEALSTSLMQVQIQNMHLMISNVQNAMTELRNRVSSLERDRDNAVEDNEETFIW